MLSYRQAFFSKQKRTMTEQNKMYNGITLNVNCDIHAISESIYSRDPETRKSVYGMKSKSGESVAVSSTDAECKSKSETAKEVIFGNNLIESIDIKAEYTIDRNLLTSVLSICLTLAQSLYDKIH